MSFHVLGFDIGGANLKAAHTNGWARSTPFELWKYPERLSGALRDLLNSAPPRGRLAVTMTGEMCDCFEHRRQGVRAILGALRVVAENSFTLIWQTDGRFVSVAEAAESPLGTASANWLALATFAGRFAPLGPALLIDIGSTTTDIVPLLDSKPVPSGRTDAERLKSRQLVYTGIRRTPVCALSGRGIAAELFATTLDAYLILGEIEEDDSDQFTADGRAATKQAAHARLARMLGADADTCKLEDTLALAREVKGRQLSIVRDAAQIVASTLPFAPRTIVLAGSGEFLAEQIVRADSPTELERISLAKQLGPALSQSACAYAVAVLASEQNPNE
jgi:probable H4MPT-linked C1 transfer pathway protein